MEGWAPLIGFTSFSARDDVSALHDLACGLLYLVFQLLAAYVDSDHVSVWLIFSHLSAFSRGWAVCLWKDGFLRLFVSAWVGVLLMVGWQFVLTWLAECSASLLASVWLLVRLCMDELFLSRVVAAMLLLRGRYWLVVLLCCCRFLDSLWLRFIVLQLFS